MYQFYPQVLLATISSTLLWQAKAYIDVKISHDGPVFLGSNITFEAELFNKNGTVPHGEFMYKWRDDLKPYFHKTKLTKDTKNFYTVSYTASRYCPGKHKMEVIVCNNTALRGCEDFTSSRVDFTITNLLNGKIIIKQLNKTVSSAVVTSGEVVKLFLVLRKGDFDFINKTAEYVRVYWLIDRTIVNASNSYELNYNFTNIQIIPSYSAIEAVVVAYYNTSQAIYTHSKIGYNFLEEILDNPNKMVFNPTNMEIPYVCNSTNKVKPNVTYGYYYENIEIKAPITNLKIDGFTWSKPWTDLYLDMSCKGTRPFKKCLEIFPGEYVVTGKESCHHDYEKLDECEFGINHHFLNSSEYTLLVIISNDVSTIVHRMLINIDEFTPKSKSSVTVVTVSSSLIPGLVLPTSCTSCVRKHDHQLHLLKLN